jgi:hypothetical protein
METNLPSRDAVPRMPVWCRRLLVCIAVFVLSVGGIHWYQRHQISVIYDRWRAEGLPTNREELANYYRPPVGGTDNSALWLPAIKEASQVDFMAWYSAEEDDEEETQVNLLLGEVSPVAGQPWDHQEVVEEFLMDHTPVLQALFHAAEPGGQARIPADIYYTFPGKARSAARLLQLETLTARYHRDLTRCLRAIRALLVLSNISEGSPDIIMALTFCAISSLGHSEVIELIDAGIAEDRHLAEIQTLVCQVDYLEVCRTCRTGEYIACVDNVYEDSRFPFATANELDILRRLELSRPAFTKPWPEMLSDLSSFSERMQALKTNRWLNTIRFQTSKPEEVFESLLFVNRLAIGMAYNNARQSSVNALLAAERHRLRHGSYPATISAIDANLIGRGHDGSTALLDPFSGKPLCYRLTDTELRIYSVGKNRLDDGGHFESAPEKGLIDIGYAVKRK